LLGVGKGWKVIKASPLIDELCSSEMILISLIQIRCFASEYNFIYDGLVFSVILNDKLEMRTFEHDRRTSLNYVIARSFFIVRILDDKIGIPWFLVDFYVSVSKYCFRH